MKWRILLILILLIFTGGIANYKELNELAIVSSIGIDKTDDGTYKVSVQVMNSKKNGSGTEAASSQSQITVYTNEDKTIQGALRSVINESPKKLHLAHLKLVILSEEVARDGLEEPLDFFMRNTDVNYEIVLLIAKEGSSPFDIISTLTPVEMNPSTNIFDSLEATFRYEGTATQNTLYKTVDKIMKEYDSNLISSVELIGNKEEGKSLENIEDSVSETKVIISNAAYFKDGKLMGYITKDETKVYNMISNDLKNAIIQTKIDDIDLAFQILESKAKTDVSMEDGSFKVKLAVDITANLTEVKGKYNIKNEDDLKKLEDALEKEIKAMVVSYLNNLKEEYKVDISGFGDMFYKKYGNKFKEKSQNYLSKIDFSIKVETSLKNEGSVLSQW